MIAKTRKSWKWEPQKGDMYWTLGNLGAAVSIWGNDLRDQKMKSVGLVLRTEAEASYAIERLKTRHRWEELSVDSGELDNPWNGYAKHWAVSYDFERSCVCVESWISIRTTDIYFASKESLKAAIEEIGEEEVKRYILGIRDKIKR